MTIVGMSNVRKSHYSGSLAPLLGVSRYCCDDKVEKRLGSCGIKDVARWVGLPHESRSAANQRRYLKIEAEVVSLAMEEIARESSLIIDATDSVVYLDDSLLNRLRRHTLVVYLETPPNHRQEMFERFMAEPKGVIWGDVYQLREGEEPRETLARCYPILLESRSERYRALANVTVPWRVHRHPQTTAEGLLAYIIKAAMD